MTGSDAHFWLIRHAPVDGPPGVIHASDAPANLEDVERIAALRSKLPGGASAFCSPARRTRETALALGLNPIEAPAFAEQSFGSWTGRLHRDIAAEMGQDYEAFWRSPADNRAPGGESFVDQVIRVGQGLLDAPAGNVILVVHSGTIRAILTIALSLAPASALRFVIDPLSLTRIDKLEQGWRVGCVNQS